MFEASPVYTSCEETSSEETNPPHKEVPYKEVVACWLLLFTTSHPSILYATKKNSSCVAKSHRIRLDWF